MSKFFRNPFATGGDKVAVPDDQQGDASVSYEEGYTVNYQEDQISNPNALDVEREKQNQLFFDITENLKEWQTRGIYPFITPALNDGNPFPYAKEAYCLFNGLVYQSLEDNNTAAPTDLSKWGRPQSFADFFADTGSANQYELVQASQFRLPDAYYIGMKVRFFASNPNTGASTVDVAGIGAVPIYRNRLTTNDLVEGDIDGLTEIEFDGTAFFIINKVLSEDVGQVSIIDTIVAEAVYQAPDALNPNPYGLATTAVSFDWDTISDPNAVTPARFAQKPLANGNIVVFDRHSNSGSAQNYIQQYSYNSNTNSFDYISQQVVPNPAEWAASNSPAILILDKEDNLWIAGSIGTNFNILQYKYNGTSFDFLGKSTQPDIAGGTPLTNGATISPNGNIFAGWGSAVSANDLEFYEYEINSQDNEWVLTGKIFTVENVRSGAGTTRGFDFFDSQGNYQGMFEDVTAGTPPSFYTYSWDDRAQNYVEKNRINGSIGQDFFTPQFFADFDGDVLWGRNILNNIFFKGQPSGSIVTAAKIGKVFGSQDGITLEDGTETVTSYRIDDNSIAVVEPLSASTVYGKFKRKMNNYDSVFIQSGLGVWRRFKNNF